MKPENKNEATRTIVIGVAQEEKNNMQVVESNAWVGNKFIPNACIKHTVQHGDQTVFLLEDAKVNSVSISVASTYTYDTNGDAVLQDIADMWNEFGEVAEQQPTVAEKESVEMPKINFNKSIPMPKIDFGSDNTDDEVPNFGDALGIELADHVLSENESEEDVAEKQAKKKLSAVQKATKARQERFAESEAIKADMSSDISKAMADGKRHEDFGAWNFKTKTYDMVARSTDPITGKDEYFEVSSEKGDTRVRAIFNPTLATEDMPLGHCLNRAIGPNFVPVEHPDIFNPIIQTVRGINTANGCVYEKVSTGEDSYRTELKSGTELITYDAFGFNKGARAMINLDLTGFSNKTRNESSKSLSNFGYVNLSANRISDALVEEEGGHRVGVSIINSHDGKSALQAFMTVLRTYCGNLAARGGVQALLMAGDKTKIRHMEGVVSEFDPELFAGQLGNALLESRKNLIAMHILRHIPIEANLFDKVMTSFASHGLVSQPTLTISAGDIDQIPKDKNGHMIVNSAMMTKDAVKVGHGHAYNAMMKGWMNPDVDYVAMDKTEADKTAVGSAFHAAQALTGTITHNPIFTDGKRVLHGQKQGIELMMKKSDKAANLLEEIAMGAVNAYAAHTGEPVDDFDAMGQWLVDNPDQFKIPYSAKKSGKKVMTAIADIPAFQDTWNYTIKQVKVATK
jgi:hypothetical protein